MITGGSFQRHLPLPEAMNRQMTKIKALSLRKYSNPKSAYIPRSRENPRIQIGKSGASAGVQRFSFSGSRVDIV